MWEKNIWITCWKSGLGSWWCRRSSGWLGRPSSRRRHEWRRCRSKWVDRSRALLTTTTTRCLNNKKKHNLVRFRCNICFCEWYICLGNFEFTHPLKSGGEGHDGSNKNSNWPQPRPESRNVKKTMQWRNVEQWSKENVVWRKINWELLLVAIFVMSEAKNVEYLF